MAKPEIISKNFEFLSERDLRPEIMDDPRLDFRKHRQALAGLGRLNLLSRVAHRYLKTIQNFFPESASRPFRILDLASGGGDVPIALARLAARHGIDIEICGCDKSPAAVDFAETRARKACVPVRFLVLDLFQDSLPEGFDLAISSLFIHHLSDFQTVSLLRSLAFTVRRGIILSDLRRCWQGMALIRLMCPLVSRSSVVYHDGVQSLRAAYTIPEIRNLARLAGLEEAVIQRGWPYRWEFVWKKEGESVHLVPEEESLKGEPSCL